FKESAVVKQTYALSQPSIHRFNPNQSSNFSRTPQGRMTERDSQKHLVGLLHFFGRANRAAWPKAAGRRRRPKRPQRARCRYRNRRELKWTERTKRDSCRSNREERRRAMSPKRRRRRPPPWSSQGSTRILFRKIGPP